MIMVKINHLMATWLATCILILDNVLAKAEAANNRVNSACKYTRVS